MTSTGENGPRAPKTKSQEVLARAARDSQTIAGFSFDGAARRLGSHFTGRDAAGEADEGGTDPIEVWGRRIGRVLSLVLALGLIGWLGFQLGWWG